MRAGDALRASTPPRLTILVNRDWFFLSHFAERARQAKAAGYEVVVICAGTGRERDIAAAGFTHVPLRIDRQSLSPLMLIGTFCRLFWIYRRWRPTVAWQIGLVPILLGTPALWMQRCRGVVNAPVGLGWTFASERGAAALLRPLLRAALKAWLGLRAGKVIFENADDLQEMLELGAVRPENAVLIRGAGVDVQRYRPRPEREGVPVVLFAARLIWEKGVREFVAAARILRQRGIDARFVIAGGVDTESRSAVPAATLNSWVQAKDIEWLGHRSDMPELLSECHVFCLPTWYREGLPKVILEAMACARAVVTTDMPGCREAVRHGDNGLLVPPKNVEALAQAIAELLHDPARRRRMGQRGRERALAEFSSDRVCRETLAVFDAVAGIRRGQRT